MFIVLVSIACVLIVITGLLYARYVELGLSAKTPAVYNVSISLFDQAGWAVANNGNKPVKNVEVRITTLDAPAVVAQPYLKYRKEKNNATAASTLIPKARNYVYDYYYPFSSAAVIKHGVNQWGFTIPQLDVAETAIVHSDFLSVSHNPAEGAVAEASIFHYPGLSLDTDRTDKGPVKLTIVSEQ